MELGGAKAGRPGGCPRRFPANLCGDRFGRPGKGNDKGKVEALVKTARRKFLVPVPSVGSIGVHR